MTALSTTQKNNIYLLRRRLNNAGMRILKQNLIRKNKNNLKLEQDISFIMSILRNIESQHELQAYQGFISQVVDKVYIWENKAIEKERRKLKPKKSDN